jgi:hypothetical protein
MRIVQGQSKAPVGRCDHQTTHKPANYFVPLYHHTIHVINHMQSDGSTNGQDWDHGCFVCRAFACAKVLVTTVNMR